MVSVTVVSIFVHTPFKVVWFVGCICCSSDPIHFLHCLAMDIPDQQLYAKPKDGMGPSFHPATPYMAQITEEARDPNKRWRTGRRSRWNRTLLLGLCSDWLTMFWLEFWLHADMWVIETWYWLVNRESCRVSQQKLDTVGLERGYKIFWQQILGELRFFSFFLWRLHYICDRRSFKSCHIWVRCGTW